MGRFMSLWVLVGLFIFPIAGLQAEEKTTEALTLEAEIKKAQVKPTVKEEAELLVMFNDMAPGLVADKIRVPQLRMSAPQWAVQQLEWLKPEEIDKYRGRASPQQTAEALQWVLRIIRPEHIPKELMANLIPLRNWAILYRDWIDHGGSDTFIVKYKLGKFVIQISEMPNYLIVAARDLELSKPLPKLEHLKFVAYCAQLLLSAELQPESFEAIIESIESPSGEITVGFWAPPEKKEEAEQEIIADSVRFFTDGQVVIFQVLKYFWTREMQNPFVPRFSPEVSSKIDEAIWQLVEKQIENNPALDSPEKRIEFYERIKSRIITKQVEEYLGPLLYDYQGNKLTATVPVTLIERAFTELNEVQKDYLLKQRKSDELYIEGLKAFNQKRYDLAVENWAHSLEIDPINVRCALLLNVAADFLKEKMLGSLGKIDYKDPTLAKAIDALLTHRQAVLKYELAQREETLKEREIASHRIRALDYYSQGQYRKAIKEWDEILKIDPENAQAALFKDMALKRLQITEPEPKEQTPQKKKP